MKYTFTEQAKLIRHTALCHPNIPVNALLLVRSLTHFARLYKEHREQLLKKFHLNETQFLALTLIYYQKEQAIQPSVLSNMLGSSRTNITRVSDELETQSLIERVVMKKDRRAYLLRLTPKGVNFLEAFIPNQWQLIENIFSVLTEEEQQCLENILQKLTNHIEQTK